MFSEYFDELCKLKCVTANKACLEMGISRSVAAKWKSTNTNPRMDTLMKLSDYFGVPLDSLLKRELPDASTIIHMTIEELDLSVPRIPPEKLSQIEQYAEFVTGKKVKLHNGKPKGKLTLEDVRQALETMNQLADDFEKKQNTSGTEESLKSFPETEEAEKIS